MEHSCYLLILMGTAIAETQILQLYLDGIKSKAICQRCIEKIRLTGYLHLLMRRHTSQRPHVMQTVCQLDQQRTDVIVDGVEHLFVVVHLLRHLIVVLALLSQDTHQESDIFSKTFLNIINRVLRVLHHIMKKGSNNGIGA